MSFWSRRGRCVLKVRSLAGGMAVGSGMAIMTGMAVGLACAPSTPPVVAEPVADPVPPDPIAMALRFDLPEIDIADLAPLSLWATYYYIPSVLHTDDGHPLHTRDGDALPPRLATVDWCEAAMQGTVLIGGPGEARDTYNYAGVHEDTQVDCTEVYPNHPAIGRSLFTVAQGPWGDGVQAMILIPYRSIAVDPETIPFGSTVYIPAARGTELTLPDGTSAIHDGWFYAADRGGAIKGTHIDVFVGAGKHNPFESWVQSKSSATFEAYVVSGAGAQRLTIAHAPPK